jgi:hypothetical protein
VSITIITITSPTIMMIVHSLYTSYTTLNASLIYMLQHVVGNVWLENTYQHVSVQEKI